MNKRQKEVLKGQLEAEKAVLEQLEKQYKKALNDINLRIKIYQSDELTQSRIYHIQYQKALKKQVEAALEKLHSDEFSTIQQYLSSCYTDAFIGTMYDIAGQGIPVIAPIDQKAAIKAVMTDSRLNKSLYDELGIDVNELKKAVSAEITRGIATGQAYEEIARNISFKTNAPLSRANTIVRTESHRIQQASAEDARQVAKNSGADVVKQWDGTLDGKTRDTHRKLDGQIRKTHEKFTIGTKEAMYPGDFGDPGEDCNCRCVALTRAKWALDDDELQKLKARAAYFELDKKDSFKEFKNKYLKAAETLENTGKSGIIKEDSNTFILDWKQFGKKVGKHASDFGYDPSSVEDRQKVLTLIYDIKNNPAEKRIGYWRGQPDEVLFYIKGDDVVITKQTGEFVTIMKGGVTNDRVKNARNEEI